MITAILAAIAADPVRFLCGAFQIEHVWNYYIGLTNEITDRILGFD